MCRRALSEIRHAPVFQFDDEAISNSRLSAAAFVHAGELALSQYRVMTDEPEAGIAIARPIGVRVMRPCQHSLTRELRRLRH